MGRTEREAFLAAEARSAKVAAERQPSPECPYRKTTTANEETAPWHLRMRSGALRMRCGSGGLDPARARLRFATVARPPSRVRFGAQGQNREVGIGSPLRFDAPNKTRGQRLYFQRWPTCSGRSLPAARAVA